MLWDHKPYHSLDFDLKKRFGEKIIKLSLDGGRTCPNRDGTLDSRGCIFCGSEGSGEFAGTAPSTFARDTSRSDLLDQMAFQKQLLKEKWPHNRFIAYFQSFSNTYCSVSSLADQCELVLSDPDVCGIALATRPDCLPDEMLMYLSQLNQRTFLWLELGLQTAHDDTAHFLNRGYSFDVYVDATKRLNALGIRHVCHLIVGLPGETQSDFISTIQLVNDCHPYGVKLHPLFVQKGTALATLYSEGKISLLSFDPLIEWLISGLENLDSSITIHRLTGDAHISLHIAPPYALNKRLILNKLMQEMKSRGSYQGIKKASLK